MAVTYVGYSIRCVQYNKWYHRKRTNLSVEEAKRQKGSNWFCGCRLERTQPHTIGEQAKVCGRYVDDIIRSAGSNKVSEILQCANTLHPNLEFTSECEWDGNWAFLDMLVTRKNSSISTTWYSKPTDTGLALGFHACAPTRYKRNIIEGTIHRINQATSTWMGFHEGLEKAVRDWEANQCPPAFYIPIVRDTIIKNCQLQTPENSQNYNTKESVNEDVTWP